MGKLHKGPESVNAPELARDGQFASFLLQENLITDGSMGHESP